MNDADPLAGDTDANANASDDDLDDDEEPHAAASAESSALSGIASAVKALFAFDAFSSGPHDGEERA